jgi:hypothetical protein
MQTSMKKTFGLLLVIVILTCTIYFVNKKTNIKHKKTKQPKINNYGVPLPLANTTIGADTLSYIKPMPTDVPLDNNVIANYPDLDRMYIEREIPSLLPANEEILTSYKDWTINGESVDKELYAKDSPLFNKERVSLTPPDINGNQRRVNFY